MLGGQYHEVNIPGQLVLRSPNGTEWKISVANDGTISAKTL